MKLKDKIEFLISKILEKKNKKDQLIYFKKKQIELYLKKGIYFNDQEKSIIQKWDKKNIFSIFEQKYEINLKKLNKNIIEQKIFHIISKINKKNYYLFIFINGFYNKFFSSESDNIINFEIINNFKKLDKKIYKLYGKLCNNKYNIFCSLNTIFSKNGLYINIPDNTLLKKTIKILHIYTNNEYQMFNPRTLIFIGKNSNVQIIDSYKFLNKNFSFINLVNEIYLSECSVINYYKLQDDIKSNNTTIIDNTFLDQKKKSIGKTYTFSIYGKVVKNNLNFFSNEKKTYSYLYGLSILSKNQSINNSTFINHSSSNSNSYQLYKNIFFKNSDGIFNGKIIVNKFLQKINAFQKNNNLLLSSESNVYTIPQLKIYSQNVKCSHGCTIGNLQKEELFYLKSRGISEKKSKILLSISFLNDVLKYFNFFDFEIKKKINKKMEKIFFKNVFKK